jgi:hypothetical protein
MTTPVITQPEPISRQQILQDQSIRCNFDFAKLTYNFGIVTQKITDYFMARQQAGILMQPSPNELIKFYYTDDFYNSVVNVANMLNNIGAKNLACLNDADPAFCNSLATATNIVNPDELLLLIKKYQPVMTSMYNLLSNYSDIIEAKCGMNPKLKNLKTSLAILGGIVQPSYDKYYIGVISCLCCIVICLFMIIGVIMLKD